MSREQLPQRRYCETFKLRHGNGRAAYHVTAGFYDGGRLGEVFIATNQVGTSMEALARDVAILMSLALQYGCPIETIRGSLTREADGAASTIAGAVADALGRP